MYTLGINTGSSNIKAALLQNGNIVWHQILPHDGDLPGTLRRILSLHKLPEDVKVLVTGTEGRYLLNLPGVIEPICVERAASTISLDDATSDNGSIDAVVSLGGEDMVVYTLDGNRKIVTSFSGNKCASGTGEFFKQQLGRMDLGLEHVNQLDESSANVLKLSSRCSVFMKSDCTHRLNKGEATKNDIILSLSNVMAVKVVDFLKRAKISSGRVVLTGGVTENRHMVRFLKEKLPNITFTVPSNAKYFEAYGAALLAEDQGGVMPASLDDLFTAHQVKFDRFSNLKDVTSRVTFIPSVRGKVKNGGRYILGVDGGSTTTKACLIDMDTMEMVACHYGRTHGNPVTALKDCLVEIQKQVSSVLGKLGRINIPLAATTGSSREILGLFLGTPAVYNEIIAHSVGVTHYQPKIDTIFEIGGQDAKYVLIKNGVPIDYAMNEACSAGTGSFLEETCKGDLNIEHAHEIGPIAMKAESPLKFGEHCSAFINSDIRKAIQQDASREDIAAGLVTSIVSNYLNRVVGNRTIGDHIVLQGGVAKNPAVPLAFALLLNKPITVPPDPELMGCYGVGLMALAKLKDGLLEEAAYTIDEILASEIVHERDFQCNACDNYCTIRVLKVGARKTMFGGRCNKYANMRKKAAGSAADSDTMDNSAQVFDYVELRNKLMFDQFSPDPATLVRKKEYTVGIPKCFSVYSLWPFYSWFFHTLGVKTELSSAISPDGVARAESAYCFPAEIAHGAVQHLFEKQVDYYFLPHARDMESMEKDVHACFCPLTQGLPYYMRQAYPEVPEDRLLMPVITFKFGHAKALESLIVMGKQLGFDENDVRKAFQTAVEKQGQYLVAAAEMGKKALEEARKSKRPVVALLGRPYNAFTSDTNMGIPRKLTTRGVSVIPFDILPMADQDIFSNMYWYYGQQDMKASALLKKEDNIFVTYITNFSCAPDSFMLHYLKWNMGAKPFLVLELDSHSADAGVDTRIEAFLDIIEGYRSKYDPNEKERYDNGLRFKVAGKDELYVEHKPSGRLIPIRNNPRIKVLLSNMGNLTTRLLAASLRSAGLNSIAQPVPTPATLQIARSMASGKECLPALLVLGEALEFLNSDAYRKDEIYLLVVPSTTGPCRTGQYHIFYQNLFRDLKIENVVVMVLDSDNSYNEIGPHFAKHAWWGVIISDVMKDIETVLRTCAADPVSALARYDELWHRLCLAAEQDVTKTLSLLRDIAAELAQIPLRRKVEDCPRVLIVGEIYVRRDDFAVDELLRRLSARGIIAKVSDVSEWILYCDFTRRYELRKKMALKPALQRPFTSEMRSLVGWNVEQTYKQYVIKSIQSALRPSGLLVDSPHHMDRIMENAFGKFVTSELESEITVSCGVAGTAMLEGFSGVINISPFACLIGRGIEGIYTPWARRNGYPTMSVEIDGNLLPANIVNKLDIFMLNVLRFGKDRGEHLAEELIDKPVHEQEKEGRNISRVGAVDELGAVKPADESGAGKDNDDRAGAGGAGGETGPNPSASASA